MTGFDGSVKGPLEDLAADGRLGLTEFRSAAVDVGSAELEANVGVSGPTISAKISGFAAGLRADRRARPVHALCGRGGGHEHAARSAASIHPHTQSDLLAHLGAHAWGGR